MRSALFALAFLHAVAASAQITISDEIVSNPLRPHVASLPFAAPAVALAKDRTGVAVAWSMMDGIVERIYVARLDGGGHVAGTVREIPVATQDATIDAVSPSLAAAPGGDGFVVAWLEVDHFHFPPSAILTLVRVAFSRLDTALTPSAPAALFPLVLPISPALVRTKADTVWISAGGALWSLAKDGKLDGPFAVTAASDMTVATNLPQVVGSHNIKGSYRCKVEVAGCDPGHGFVVCSESCRVYSFTYSLDFTALYTASVSKTYSYVSDGQPAIQSSGSDVLVAWFRGAQASGGDVVLSRMAAGDFLHFADAVDQSVVVGSFRGDFGATRPDIATDSARSVVVWRSQISPWDHDIVGIAVDNDGKLIPLSIATSPADERDPSILSLGDGTFLVAYEKGSAAGVVIERRIAGRFVTFGRRRSVR